MVFEPKKGGGKYLACRLTNPDVPTGDYDDLSGQIWDVLCSELRFWNEEVGAEGRSVDESPKDIESRCVLSHLGLSSGGSGWVRFKGCAYKPVIHAEIVTGAGLRDRRCR